MRRSISTVSLLLCLVLLPASAFAFPNTERIGVGGTNPPFNFNFTDTVTGFVLKDDQTAFASYGETLSIVDLAFYVLAKDQPPPLTTTAGNDGRLAAITYSPLRNRVYATQEDGDVLVYDMDKITVDPVSTTIVDGNKLGPIALDNSARNAYIVNTQDHSVHVLDLTALTVTSVIVLQLATSKAFNINAMTHVPLTDEIYVATDKGAIFYIPAGGTVATAITIDSTNLANYPAIAPTVDGTFVYVVDETNSKLVKISTSSHTVIKDNISLSENPGPTGIVIAQVTRPEGGGENAEYAFVAGSKGMSVMNTAGDYVLNLGTDTTKTAQPIPMSVVPRLVVASSVNDGYVYSVNATQSVGVLTANPWVTISSLTYSGGGDTMGIGQSFTLAFQADEVGTATLFSGGDVSGSGTALKDASGATSWAIDTAATDISVTIPYDDNKDAFIEGANTIFIFVANADGDRGRLATTVNVDTPPPNVTIESTGFGSSRIYVTFDRLDVADMNHYNVYVDTNPDAVLTKADVAATVSQASSGSTQQASVEGLQNEIAYFIAIEAVDNGGNVSPSRTNTFADGSTAYAIPQNTGGPVEFSNEKGCSLVPISKSLDPSSANEGHGGWSLIITFLFILMMRIKTGRLSAIYLINAASEARSIPPHLSLDGRGGVRVTLITLPFVPSRQGRGIITAKRCPTSSCFETSPKVRGHPRTATRLPRSVIDYSAAEGSEQRVHHNLRILIIIFFLLISLAPLGALAKEPSPQWWSMEVKTGFWMPQGSAVKHFFENCCNLITRIQGGLLVHGRYGAELGVGFLYKSGDAAGTLTGETSQDRFNFILVPIETNFAWRLNYWSWDYVVPYIKAGFDYVYFREGLNSKSTQGLKYGVHGVAGAQIDLKLIDEGAIKGLDDDFGINDLFITLEAQYQYINNFGSEGLNLSGPVYSIGLLFTF